MAKERFTIMYDIQDAGGQQLANWKEGEVYTDKEEHKNAGSVNAAYGTLITNEFQTGRVVTIEAESVGEAIRALRTWITAGPTNPAGVALATPVTGTSGGFVNGKALVCKTSSLTEESMIP